MLNYIDIIYISIKNKYLSHNKNPVFTTVPLFGYSRKEPPETKNRCFTEWHWFIPFIILSTGLPGFSLSWGFEAEVRVLVLKDFSRSIYHRHCSFMIAHPFLFCPARRNLCWKISYPILGCIATITPTEIRRNYVQINQ